MNIDLNLATDAEGAVVCRHCGATLGPSTAEPLTHALRSERPSSAAGPGIHADPALFVDRPIVLRRTCCPGCLVLLATEVVPGDEPSYRNWSLR